MIEPQRIIPSDTLYTMVTKMNAIINTVVSIPEEVTAEIQEELNTKASIEYVDSQVALITAEGIPKLASYYYTITSKSDGQTVFNVPLETFDKNTDTLLVFQNTTFIGKHNYTINDNNTFTLNVGVNKNTLIEILILKNVPIGPEGSINGNVLAVNSIPMDRIKDLLSTLGNINDETLPVELRGKSLTEQIKQLKKDVNDHKAENVQQHGDLSILKTTEKSNLVGAINELFQSGVESNQALVDGLNSKGVPATVNDTIKSNVNKVNLIEVGDYKIGEMVTPSTTGIPPLSIPNPFRYPPAGSVDMVNHSGNSINIESVFRHNGVVYLVLTVVCGQSKRESAHLAQLRPAKYLKVLNADLAYKHISYADGWLYYQHKPENYSTTYLRRLNMDDLTTIEQTSRMSMFSYMYVVDCDDLLIAKTTRGDMYVFNKDPFTLKYKGSSKYTDNGSIMSNIEPETRQIHTLEWDYNCTKMVFRTYDIDTGAVIKESVERSYETNVTRQPYLDGEQVIYVDETNFKVICRDIATWDEIWVYSFQGASSNSIGTYFVNQSTKDIFIRYHLSTGNRGDGVNTTNEQSTYIIDTNGIVKFQLPYAMPNIPHVCSYGGFINGEPFTFGGTGSDATISLWEIPLGTNYFN